MASRDGAVARAKAEAAKANARADELEIELTGARGRLKGLSR